MWVEGGLSTEPNSTNRDSCTTPGRRGEADWPWSCVPVADWCVWLTEGEIGREWGETQQSAALPPKSEPVQSPPFHRSFFKCKNSPSLSLLPKQFTMYPVCTLYLIERLALNNNKKSFFHIWEQFQRTHLGKLGRPMCTIYLERHVGFL